jgi:hypothetical protein
MTELFEQKVRDAGNSLASSVVVAYLAGLTVGDWCPFHPVSKVYRDVATRQQTASGTITAHEPGNHSRYGYTFIVEGRSYYGWQIPQGSEEWTENDRVISQASS